MPTAANISLPAVKSYYIIADSAAKKLPCNVLGITEMRACYDAFARPAGTEAIAVYMPVVVTRGCLVVAGLLHCKTSGKKQRGARINYCCTLQLCTHVHSVRNARTVCSGIIIIVMASPLPCCSNMVCSNRPLVISGRRYRLPF